MAKFDQRGQKVVNQYNADVINFGSVQNKAELISEMRKLVTEVNKATQAAVIEEKISIDVESHLKKAVIEMKEPSPNKATILEHIEGAKKLLESVTSATSLVTALIQAAKIAGEIFR